MRRSTLGAAVLVVVGLIALAVPLSGCEVVRVSVIIPDFDSGRVQGVTFWRHESGGYVEDGRLLFEAVEYRGADELIRYRFRPCHGEPSRIAYRARLERSVTDPDVVLIELLYPRRSRPGVFRISAFNSGGESPMTEASVNL